MNWGQKLVIGLASFMVFILALGAYMISRQSDDALVDKDYYQKGIDYDQEYNWKQNVLDRHMSPEIKTSGSQLVIQLKTAATYELQMMRPSDAHADRSLKGETLGEQHLILINKNDFKSGAWHLTLKWTNQGETYLYSRDIIL